MGHMDPGCLDDWEQHVELYLHLARLRMSCMSMVNLSRKVMAVLKPREEYVVASVEPVINGVLNMPLDELKNKVWLNHPVSRAYKAVFFECDDEDS
jgi:peptidoglycan biosynthesis protein MviN/MurJ (putative lipid II flippase)